MIINDEEPLKRKTTIGYRWNLSSNAKPAKPKDTVSSNPKDRVATSRLDLSMFPQTALAYGALAMVEGHQKYGSYNYRITGVSVSTYVAALMRHVSKYYNGEWADEKTHVPHLANALACLAVIIDSYEMGNLIDDRPPATNMSQLLKDFQEIVCHLQKTFPNTPGRCTQKNRKRVVKKEVRHERQNAFGSFDWDRDSGNTHRPIG